MTSRRHLLVSASGAVLATAGCLGLFEKPPISKRLTLTPVPEAEVAATFSFEPDELSDDASATVEEGVPDGTTRYGIRPLDDGTVVLVDGTYYETRVTSEGPTPVTKPILRVDPVAEPSGEVGTVTGWVATLVECAVETTRDADGMRPCVIYDGNESAFLPEPDFESVEYDGSYYDLSVSRETVTLEAFDFEFDVVAESRDAFLTSVDEKRLNADFDRTDLSEKQRSILEEAVEEGAYESEAPPTDAFEQLASDFGDGRRHLVRFDAKYYRAEITTTAA